MTSKYLIQPDYIHNTTRQVLEGIVEEVTHGTGLPGSNNGMRLTGGLALQCRVPVRA